MAQQLAICLAEGRTKLTISEIERHLDELLEELYPGSNPVAVVGQSTDCHRFAEAWQRYFKRGKIRSIQWLQQKVRCGHFARDTPFWGSDFNAILPEVGGYEGFFSRFGFRCVDGQVSFSPEPGLLPEEQEDLDEQRRLPKTEPYTHAGWRQVGVTAQMVAGLCERLGRKVRVIHNDTCVFE